MLTWIKALALATGTSGAFSSLGVMGPIVAMVVMGVNTWWHSYGGTGDLIATAELNSQINSVIAVVGFVLAIYGRIRAVKKIGGGELE